MNKYMNNSNSDMRIFILNLFIILGGVILISQLFNLQIVQGEDYRAQAESRVLKQTSVSAPRGEMLDRHGAILATNRDGYNVLLYKQSMTTKERNDFILRLANLLISKNTVYRDTFPISVGEEISFIFDSKNDENKWKKRYKFSENATPEEVINSYITKYELEDYSLEDSRLIIGIRYELDRVGYSSLKPYELATDVSMELVAELEERYEEFPGVNVEIQPIRVYPNNTLASHILGYIGKISPEKYEELKNEGYSNDDNIGKDGIESLMERFLRGKNSLQKVEVSASGNYTNMSENIGGQAGAQVYLTIDAKLQKVAEDALKETIYNIANGKYADGSTEAQSGAVVAIDVNTGEILAMASYPDYDPNLFVKGISNENWKKLNTSTKPMFNRNIMGLYSPGSIFKMVVAVAALEEKAITPETKYLDEGVYTKYRSPQPKCWIWSSSHRTHGEVNVADAIKTSCNYFFYKVSELIGIDKIEEYSKAFGLGSKTGIELPGEKAGIVAGRTYKEGKLGEDWLVGETLSAAIGQSYHSFTPIQIAKYAAILANGGEKITPQIIKDVVTTDGRSLTKEEIRSYVSGEINFDYDNEGGNLNISEKTLKAVYEGMESVTGDSGGTAYNTFKNFPIKVAGKTGSVQVSGSKADNAWFMGFAPYDNPEIAICALVEHGVHGTYTAPIIVAILEEYFGLKEESSNIDINAVKNDNTMM